MIHRVTAKNFYSIHGGQTIDFTVNEHAPDTTGYFTTPSGARLTRLLAVIGPNASGKTNVLRILGCLKWLLVESFRADPNESLPLSTFMLDKSTVSVLSVDFEMNGTLYRYLIEADSQSIWKEELYQRSTKTKRLSSLFRRHWNEFDRAYETRKKLPGLEEEIFRATRPNATVVATGAQFNLALFTELQRYWSNLFSLVPNIGESPRPENLVPSLGNIEITIDNLTAISNMLNRDKDVQFDAKRILCSLDLGIEDFEMLRLPVSLDTENRHEAHHMPMFHHAAHDGPKKLFGYSYESRGTLGLYLTVPVLVLAMRQGMIVVLDELDSSLHPHHIAKLLDIFRDPAYNTGGAQLIFTCHNMEVLRELDKYQILLTEKNADGETEVWRLDEMEGVRADENFYARYMAGAYGAVPNL